MREEGAISRPSPPGGCDAPAVADNSEPDGMQSLLARAVEDQAHEQRLVSTTLVQIQDQLGALTAHFDGLAAQVADRDDVAEVAARLDALHPLIVGLGAERERGDALTRALVLEFEQRVLAHVDDAVYALAKALLPPRKRSAVEVVPDDPAALPAEPAHT
jgi:hypothetical protein